MRPEKPLPNSEKRAIVRNECQSLHRSNGGRLLCCRQCSPLWNVWAYDSRRRPKSTQEQLQIVRVSGY